ncbi:MAG: 2,4-dihydroxyhept-2-ene-1,7-dioic acid aldolase [bacterium]|nr:2,4-dihydroxyhept-2-ene-1,7-dioic acid aldolase [bacterium]
MSHSFKFRQEIKEGQPLIGTIQTLDSPEVSEIISTAGYDWLFVDLEHSTLDPGAAQRILQTVGSRCPCILRVPGHDEVWIKKILDTGAAGILFPKVNSAPEAKRIVDLCKYPPQGRRSVGLARAQGYGMAFRDYVDTANHDIAVVMQIEDIKAVDNIESIVKVPGIDALFLGPYDLSASMGKAGQVKDPDVLRQIQKVRTVCLEARLALGIFTVNPHEVNAFIKEGYTLIAVGIDTSILAKTMKENLAAIRK